MIEGLWNMPLGSEIRIDFTQGPHVFATIRWSRENRVGVEFHEALRRRADGSFEVLGGPSNSATAAANG